MSREVTVRVPLEESLDLLKGSARACVGSIREGQPHIAPVRLRYEGGRYLIGIHPEALDPDSSDEIVLVVDEGVLFFELRAIYVRGVAQPLPSVGEEDLSWVVVEPSRISSWNYGRMRWTRETR